MLSITTYYCDDKEFGTISDVETYLMYMFDEIEEIDELVYACYDTDGNETIIEVEEVTELL